MLICDNGVRPRPHLRKRSSALLQDTFFERELAHVFWKVFIFHCILFFARAGYSQQDKLAFRHYREISLMFLRFATPSAHSLPLPCANLSKTRANLSPRVAFCSLSLDLLSSPSSPIRANHSNSPFLLNLLPQNHNPSIHVNKKFRINVQFRCIVSTSTFLRISETSAIISMYFREVHFRTKGKNRSRNHRLNVTLSDQVRVENQVESSEGFLAYR